MSSTGTEEVPMLPPGGEATVHYILISLVYQKCFFTLFSLEFVNYTSMTLVASHVLILVSV